MSQKDQAFWSLTLEQEATSKVLNFNNFTPEINANSLNYFDE